MSHQKGDPCTTDECPGTIWYAGLGLCRKCYNRNYYADKKLDREAAREEELRQPPKSYLFLVRANGEPDEIRFRSDIHPGIFKRLLMIGDSEEKIADVMGVSVQTLKLWISRRPEMQEALMHRRMRNAYMLEAARNLALGRMNDKGAFMGGHAGLLMFFLEHDLGMGSKARKNEQDAKDNIRELVNEESVKRLMRKFGINPDKGRENDDGGDRDD